MTPQGERCVTLSPVAPFSNFTIAQQYSRDREQAVCMILTHHYAHRSCIISNGELMIQDMHNSNTLSTKTLIFYFGHFTVSKLSKDYPMHETESYLLVSYLKTSSRKTR